MERDRPCTHLVRDCASVDPFALDGPVNLAAHEASGQAVTDTRVWEGFNSIPRVPRPNLLHGSDAKLLVQASWTENGSIRRIWIDEIDRSRRPRGASSVTIVADRLPPYPTSGAQHDQACARNMDGSPTTQRLNPEPTLPIEKRTAIISCFFLCVRPAAHLSTPARSDLSHIPHMPFSTRRFPID